MPPAGTSTHTRCPSQRERALILLDQVGRVGLSDLELRQCDQRLCVSALGLDQPQYQPVAIFGPFQGQSESHWAASTWQKLAAALSWPPCGPITPTGTSGVSACQPKSRAPPERQSPLCVVSE